jgi:hypothetical protein
MVVHDAQKNLLAAQSLSRQHDQILNIGRRFPEWLTLRAGGVHQIAAPGISPKPAKEEKTMSESKEALDLLYRPASYFWPISHETHAIAAIKGERRRNVIREAYDTNRVSVLDEYYSTPVLHEQDRRALGLIHPSFMGGEYLPNRQETEVEIARINIDSTTSDVTSIYAKPGKNRIYYRVVDEYNGDTLNEKRTRSSRQPLTLDHLVEFFLGAWSLKDVLDGNDLNLEEAYDFTHPSSEFYPQFGAAIRARIDSWYPAKDPDEEQDDE